MKNKLAFTIGMVAGSSLLSSCTQEKTLQTNQVAAKDKTNVLMIIADDMNDWVGCLKGHPNVKTPNIDRLAKRGMLFTNAHTRSPICGPSRASVLTGMIPENSNVYTNRGTWINYLPKATSLPKFMKNSGYFVAGSGKINHSHGVVVESDWSEYGPGAGCVGGPFTSDQLLQENMDPTVTVKIDNHPEKSYTLPFNGISLIDRPNNRWSTFDWGPVDIPDSDMPDGQVADYTCDLLGKKMDNPFFITAGFYRPHQPFFVPRQYFDMYDLDTIVVPNYTKTDDLADVPRAGKELALGAWTSGTHKTVIKHNKWKEGVRGYLASISFVDAQVGKILDALDKSEYADNTMIVFWTDHGWHLGEKRHWGKHTPWHHSTRVPFIIIPPKKWGLDKEGFVEGRKSASSISLVDLYPTILSAAGMEVPKHLDGKNLLPILTNPKTKVRKASVVTIGRGTNAVTDGKWRYIEWFDGSIELYNLKKDPRELKNLAYKRKDLTKEHKRVIRRLKKEIPVDKNIKQFIRCDNWKMVRFADGHNELFDFDAPAGISEQNNLGDEPPSLSKLEDEGSKSVKTRPTRYDISKKILAYIKEKGIKKYKVTLPAKILK